MSGIETIEVLGPNKASVIAALETLFAEWQAWQQRVDAIVDQPYDRHVQSDVFADGKDMMLSHEILQQRTLAFLNKNIRGHGFISGSDGERIDRTDLRLKIRVEHRMRDLAILRGVLMASDVATNGLSNTEMFTVVNRYIGVKDGYLGDFSYRTHADFYPEFCDLDIDPFKGEGTTRDRFLAILKRSEPAVQAKVLRGIIQKYPAGSSELRTPERLSELEAMIRRLEAGCGVASLIPGINSEIVTKAISDAEALLRMNGATSGIDRMHTAFHGFLRVLCERSQIQIGLDASVTTLYKALRERHPKLKDTGPHSGDIDRVLKSFASAVDSLNKLRNHASVAHPNEQLLEREEAYLYVNAVRTLMAYIDAKVSA